MGFFRKIRFSMGTIMMFVVMAAAGMALFVKIHQLTDKLAALSPSQRAGRSTFPVCFC